MTTLDLIVNRLGNVDYINQKSILLFIFSSFLTYSASFAQKQKEVELIVECVEYIGNDTYRVNFGYDNPNKNEIIVPDTSSVVIYNNGKSKKKALNNFLVGRQSNVFTQEFTKKDRCVWRVLLPNGTEKLTSASASSVHCRDSGIGLEPIFDGFNEGGVIWPELYYLAQDYANNQDIKTNEVFQISSDDQVLIDVIAIQGQKSSALSILRGLGLSNEVDNGLSSLIITGYLPVVNVLELNNHGDIIRFVRPVYHPIFSAGTVLSQGDSAQGSDVVRNGWGLFGEGIDIGILSDSYDNLGKAVDEVINENLPGSTAPGSLNTNPVVVLKDYPNLGIFFSQRDEGQAMAQIVHDVVPKANIYFHTAMISPGDFTKGVLKLAGILPTDNGSYVSCDMIVDDITYITEPYFQDGLIAQAVNQAAAQGVYCATSAGNFGDQSWESTSAPISFNRNDFDFLPNDNSLLAHDFGNGAILQSAFLMPGRYLIKFEWDEPFYTLNQGNGAISDFDVWVVDDSNNLLYTGRRDNVGEDPQEYLGFTVPEGSAIPLNFLITAPNMPAGLKMKYTIFVSPPNGFVWNDQYAGIEAGTIFGHANALGAVAVGAALYQNTPPYGLQVPTIASFSSRGGVFAKNQSGVFEDRFKPDFVGPNGVNTTVDLGGINIDGDSHPNFFGTSASAPHNVGVAAQIFEAGIKYYGETWNPTQIKEIMKTSAIDMAPETGHDYESGFGYVQANLTLQNLANPSPQLISLLVPEGITPGEEQFQLIVEGDFFTEDSKIIFRDSTLETTYISDSQLSANIGEFIGDPEVTVENPSLAPLGNDGGIANALTFFGIEPMDVVITSDNKTKYYLEEIPEYTYTVTGLPDGVTLESLGLAIVYDAPADQYSNVGFWKIDPHFVVDPEVGLTELYNFIFPDVSDQGKLEILNLDIQFTPQDITGLYYGDSIPEINTLVEVLTPGVTISPEILNEIVLEYQSYFSPDIDYALSNASRSLANASRSIANASRSLANGTAWLITETGIANQARSIANQSRSIANQSRSIANGNTVVDIDTELIEGYEDSPGGTELILNAARSIANASRGLANTSTLATGDLGLITNAARSIANTGALINSETFNDQNNSEVVLIFDKDNTDLDGGEAIPITNIYPIHLITGLETTSEEDNPEVANSCWILPGAYISNGNMLGRYSIQNFNISYGQGLIFINPAPITVIAEDTSAVYGVSSDPEFTFNIAEETPLLLEDDESIFTGALSRTETGNYNVGSYTIQKGSLSAGENYQLTVIEGIYTISHAIMELQANNQIVEYGTIPEPELTFEIVSGELFGDDEISGELIREPGLTVGDYEISQGTISAGSNYQLSVINGVFTIIPVRLEVSAISLEYPILEGGDLPDFEFVFGICNPEFGFKNGDTELSLWPEGIESLTSPNYNGSPGVFDILFNSYNENYTIVQVQCDDPGQFYVNPFGPSTPNVHPRLDCIQETGDSEYPYVAHLYYENPNPTPVFVPVGESNRIYYTDGIGEFKIEPEQPVIFKPGIGWFDVYFNGEKIIWELTSYKTSLTEAISSDASVGSQRCSDDISSGSRLAEGNVSIDNKLNEEITGYPNPVSKTFYITLAEDMINTTELSIFDITGKEHSVPVNRYFRNNIMEVNVEHLKTGIYLLKLNTDKEQKVIRLVKQ